MLIDLQNLYLTEALGNVLINPKPVTEERGRRPRRGGDAKRVGLYPIPSNNL